VGAGRTAEVMLDLAPDAECWRLRVGRVRSDADSSSSVSATIRQRGGKIRVYVSVPESTAPGRYRARILDECDVRRGWLTVSVRESRDEEGADAEHGGGTSRPYPTGQPAGDRR
jgi:hypothetical protein